MKATCMYHNNTLTRGRKYEILDQNERNIKINDNNDKILWFPKYFFDLSGGDAPKIISIWIELEQCEDGITCPEDNNTGVSIALDNGEEYFAQFYTYKNIISMTEKNKETGELLSGKYFWGTNMLLIDEISRKRIEEVVEHLLGQLTFKHIFN
jgi:hypothetical protein